MLQSKGSAAFSICRPETNKLLTTTFEIFAKYGLAGKDDFLKAHHVACLNTETLKKDLEELGFENI